MLCSHSVLGNILFECFLSTSTSTQTKKYLKYKYQNTCSGAGGTKSKWRNMYANVITSKLCLTVNFFSIND